ncbi:uncharacterized protein LOC114938219 [Nylanderia fulva]|uniref:uncharacterized protein LOC114938219 n=1 Tax=Nylanderia fulva TaxID=613905 RepID=UPI0010FB810C|nr:uncharacterized protein LOC114938219 [Nylanderia fulva]
MLDSPVHPSEFARDNRSSSRSAVPFNEKNAATSLSNIKDIISRVEWSCSFVIGRSLVRELKGLSRYKSSLDVYRRLIAHATHDGEKVVILDEKIDELLPVIRELILKNGLDPANVPDITQDIDPNIPGKINIMIEHTKGILQNLSTIKRTERVHGIYKDKVLTLDMNLRFDVLNCSYATALSLIGDTMTGGVYGRFYDLDINIVARIDMVNYYVYLDSLKFSDVRKFESHLSDLPNLNILTEEFKYFFEYNILTVIEKRSLEMFREKIDEWNNKFPRPNLTWIVDIGELIHNLDKC